MGCSLSKIEPAEEAPAGLRPIRRRMVGEIKRRRRVRKGSISTAELLRPEDLEAIDAAADGDEPQFYVKSPDPAKESAATEKERDKQSMPAPIAKKTEEEMAAKAAGEEAEEENEREEENSRKLGSSATVTEDEEELPGSPSFRFYFVAAAKDSDEDSVKAGIDVEKDEKLEEKKTEHTHEREASNESLTSGEESDFKPSEKKGKRFRVLTKAPTVVYSLLNVRNCYCNNPVDVGVVRENQLLTGKAA